MRVSSCSFDWSERNLFDVGTPLGIKEPQRRVLWVAWVWWSAVLGYGYLMWLLKGCRAYMPFISDMGLVGHIPVVFTLGTMVEGFLLGLWLLWATIARCNLLKMLRLHFFPAGVLLCPHWTDGGGWHLFHWFVPVGCLLLPALCLCLLRLLGWMLLLLLHMSVVSGYQLRSTTLRVWKQLAQDVHLADTSLRPIFLWRVRLPYGFLGRDPGLLQLDVVVQATGTGQGGFSWLLWQWQLAWSTLGEQLRVSGVADLVLALRLHAGRSGRHSPLLGHQRGENHLARRRGICRTCTPSNRDTGKFVAISGAEMVGASGSVFSNFVGRDVRHLGFEWMFQSPTVSVTLWP